MIDSPSETNAIRLARLHEELAVLYRYKVTDKARLEPYWVRIDRIEDALKRESLLDERALSLRDKLDHGDV